MHSWRAIVLAVALMLVAARSWGYEPITSITRPFVYTVTPTSADAGWLVHYDLGYAKRATDTLANNGVEQGIGINGPLGYGLTLRGHLAVGDEGRGDSRTAWDVEVLDNLIGEGEGAHLAIGLGSRREWDGTVVALGRLSIGEDLGRWGLFGNLRLERPFAAGRDSVDLITTLAWTYRANHWLNAGLEAFGEDLEGLWQADETEGGAKLMLGPSLYLLPWGDIVVNLFAGPIAYVTHSVAGASTTANDGTFGYALHLSIGRSF